MKKWQIAISILLVFALGTAAGAYSSRVMFKEKVKKALRTEEPPGVQFIHWMMGRLDLSETQRASINAILDENNKKWETIHEEYSPQINELYETVIEETKKVLTDQQRKEIEQMSAKLQGRLPRRNYSRPRSSAPKEGSGGPPSMNQPFGSKPEPDRVANIIEELHIKKNAAEVRPIIEADLKRRQMLGDELEKSQAAAEEKFQKDMADAKAASEKKLSKLLTPEQLETYKRMMSPEEPRPENFGNDFEFDAPGDAMEPKDFNQGKLPSRPEGQPAAPPQGSLSI